MVLTFFDYMLHISSFWMTISGLACQYFLTSSTSRQLMAIEDDTGSVRQPAQTFGP